MRLTLTTNTQSNLPIVMKQFTTKIVQLLTTYTTEEHLYCTIFLDKSLFVHFHKQYKNHSNNRRHIKHNPFIKTEALPHIPVELDDFEMNYGRQFVKT